MQRILLSVVVVGMLAGCAGTDKKDEGAPVEERAPQVTTKPDTTPPPPPPQKSVEPTTKKVESQSVTANPLKDPGNILSKRSIYFDYDSSAVKDEYKPLVSAHAKFLIDHRNRKVTIQGNTDERGSREYNIGLGQRRADSVKKMMMLLGVADNQVDTVSFGEEKPIAEGNDEAAYAKNRRDDIVYDGE